MFSDPSVIWGPINHIQERVPAHPATPASPGHEAAYRLGTPHLTVASFELTLQNNLHTTCYREAAAENHLSMMKGAYSGG